MHWISVVHVSSLSNLGINNPLFPSYRKGTSKCNVQSQRKKERKKEQKNKAVLSHLTGVGESSFQDRSIHKVRRDSMLRCYHPLLFLRLTFHLPVFWILLVFLVFNLTKHNRYKNGNT